VLSECFLSFCIIGVTEAERSRFRKSDCGGGVRVKNLVIVEMAGRYDSNPFDEDDVNPFFVSKLQLGYRISIAFVLILMLATASKCCARTEFSMHLGL